MLPAGTNFPPPPDVKDKKHPPAGPAPESMTFEEALAALEEVVSRMEAADIPLDELVASYEKGARLHARCEAMLADAKRRIEQIVPGPGGGAQTLPFDPASGAAAPGAPEAGAQEST